MSVSTPTRTYRRKVALPADAAENWPAVLGRMETVVREHAVQAKWRSTELSITVEDEGGSFKTESVSEAASIADNSRHRVTAVVFDFAEVETYRLPSRVVHARLSRHRVAPPQATVEGPNEAEVIGLAGLLQETLEAKVPRPRLRPPLPDPAVVYAGLATNVRVEQAEQKEPTQWWRSQWFLLIVIPVLVTVVGTLVANAIWGLF